MESIYNQLNRIDDKESLSEKYNVRTFGDLKKLVEAVGDKLYRVDIFSYSYSRMNPKPHTSRLMPKEFNTLDDALEFFNRVTKLDQVEYTFLKNTSTSCVEYVRIVSPTNVVEKEWYHPTYGSHHESKTTSTVKKSDVEKYLRSHQEAELSEKEFKYVVEDLWNAIQRELQAGSVYNTIEDVNMSELIDASDNPTHDLCYKLLGLYNDDPLDEELIQEDTRAQLIKKIKQDLNGANVSITTSDGNVHIHSNSTGADYDILFDKTAEVASTSSGYSKKRFTGNGTIVNGDIIDSNGTNLGPAFVGSPLTSNRYHYTIRSNDVKMPQTYDQMIAGLKADAL